MDGLGGMAMLLAFLAPFVVYAGYTWLCAALGFLVWWILRNKARVAALPLGIATAFGVMFIPFADYFPQRQRIDNLCVAEGGLKVIKTVKNVTGVHGLTNAIDFGYEFGEIYQGESSAGFSNEDKTRPLVRYFRAPPEQVKVKGRFVEVKVDQPTIYGLRTSQEYLGDMIYRVSEETYVLETNEILGRSVFFYSVTQPHHETGLSWNMLRGWMKMRCRDIDDRNFSFILTRELLKETLVPN